MPPSLSCAQVHELATAVYQIRGHIKGKTLLPFPQGIADIDDEERRVRESDGKEVRGRLKSGNFSDRQQKS